MSINDNPLPFPRGETFHYTTTTTTTTSNVSAVTATVTVNEVQDYDFWSPVSFAREALVDPLTHLTIRRPQGRQGPPKPGPEPTMPEPVNQKPRRSISLD